VRYLWCEWDMSRTRHAQDISHVWVRYLTCEACEMAWHSLCSDTHTYLTCLTCYSQKICNMYDVTRIEIDDIYDVKWRDTRRNRPRVWRDIRCEACITWLRHSFAYTCMTWHNMCRTRSFLETGFWPLYPSLVWFVPLSRTKRVFLISTRTRPRS